MFMPHRLHMRLAGEVADYSPDDASPARLATCTPQGLQSGW